jgi:hypothetical protein
MKKGDRVILISGAFGACSERPYQGTEFACAGVIKEIFFGHFSKEEMARVLWDNGCAIGVYTENLTLGEGGPKQIDPNLAFLHKKRGMNG